MNNILERIKKIANHEGISITALEQKIGASKGVLSRAINNGTDIQYKWVQILVENYPHYSTDWLLTGKGEMLKSTNDKTQSHSIVGDKNLIGSGNKIYEVHDVSEVLKQKETQIDKLLDQINNQSSQINTLLSMLSKQ